MSSTRLKWLHARYFQPVWGPGWLSAEPVHKICSRCRKLGRSQVRINLTDFCFHQITHSFTRHLFQTEQRLWVIWSFPAVGRRPHKVIPKYVSSNIWTDKNRLVDSLWYRRCYSHLWCNFFNHYISVAIGSVTIAPTLWQKRAMLKRSTFRWNWYNIYNTNS